MSTFALTAAPPVRRIAAIRFVAAELAVWTGLYGAYLLLRSLVIADESTAVANAHAVVALERATGTAVEAAVQRAADPVVGLLSAYYMLGFAPVVAVALVWLAVRDRDGYRELRTALLASIGIAFVVHAAVPTAPPRLVDGLGIADTVGLGGHDTGSFLGVPFNPYAAMPSMHVGWSLLVGLALRRAASARSLRLAAAIHPALMTLTVTATGNHYLADSVAGAAVALAGLAAARLAGRSGGSDCDAQRAGASAGGGDPRRDRLAARPVGDRATQPVPAGATRPAVDERALVQEDHAHRSRATPRVDAQLDLEAPVVGLDAQLGGAAGTAGALACLVVVRERGAGRRERHERRRRCEHDPHAATIATPGACAQSDLGPTTRLRRRSRSARPTTPPVSGRSRRSSGTRSSGAPSPSSR